MGQDKQGNERKQCTEENCDCEEYEVPGNGDDCDFCGCEPTKHALSESTNQIQCTSEVQPTGPTSPVPYRKLSEKDKINRDLYRAARYSDHNKVCAAIGKGAYLDYSDSGGWTSLRAACKEGSLVIVRELLNAGAGINIATKDGWTPLNTACVSGNLDIVKELILHGADMNIAENLKGRTPLYNASHRNHLDIVRFLKKKGADTIKQNKEGRTPWDVADRKGYTKIMKVLLNGEDIEEFPDNAGLAASNPTGYNCAPVKGKLGQELYQAARSGNHHSLVSLIKRGADVNYQDKGGWTPLRAAVFQRNIQIVKELLAADANKDIPTNQGWTALNTACFSGDLEIVKELIKSGANINIPENEGRTPLYIACQKNHLEIVKALIQANADSTKSTNNGNTPESIASSLGRTAILKELQNVTDNVEIPNDGGD